MKKIPTLFERIYDNNRIVGITDHYDSQFQWIFDGKGAATIKWDGSCCAIINGELYKRYDAKNGKPIPEGAIKCQPEADPITGHLPCWVKCNRDNPSDKWFWAAYDNTDFVMCWPGDVRDGLDPAKHDWTYEAIGKHFQGNPYKLDVDILIPHGQDEIPLSNRSFESIKHYLSEQNIEGIVFWYDDKPECKIKASDFGLDWKTHADGYKRLLMTYAKGR